MVGRNKSTSIKGYLMTKEDYKKIVAANRKKLQKLKEEYEEKKKPILEANDKALNEYLKNAIYSIGDRVQYKEGWIWNIGYISSYSLDRFSIDDHNIKYILKRSKSKGTEESKVLANCGVPIEEKFIKPILQDA